MVNKVDLLGRLARALKLRYTPQGNAFCALRVATHHRTKGENASDFHDIVVWNRLAETCAKTLTLGEVVFVEGRIEHSSWESEGTKKHRMRVVAYRVHFLGKGHKGFAVAGGQPDPEAPAEDPEP